MNGTQSYLPLSSAALALLLSACALSSTARDVPSTFANPLDLEYRFMPDTPSHRTAADPVVALHGDDYYLFATGTGGYWRSSDLRRWQLIEPQGLPLEQPAPAVVSIDGRMYYTAHRLKELYVTDDPATGRWRRLTDLDEYADPVFLLDDDQRLYLYYGASLNGGISVVELDPRRNFAVIDGPHLLFSANYAEHGWERSGPENLGAPMAEGFRIAPWIEGPWITNHAGTYYLQYSAPGTVWKTYADGVYTSRSPTRDFRYQTYSPFSYRPGGFIGSAGHGAMFRDRDGNYWRVVTQIISVKERFERRLGLFPAGFDEDGVIRTDTYLGDYPQFVPGVVDRPLDRNRTGWMLLSFGQLATASSTEDGYPVAQAFDEEIRTLWSARTGNPGEWLRVDLGDTAQIHAVQVNFGEHRTTALGRVPGPHQRYLLEASRNGSSWFTLADRSRSRRDAPHDYIELERPATARFVRITNIHAAGGGTFSIRDLRIFGYGDVALPDPVTNLEVRRDANDPRTVRLSWSPADRARGYVVRFGIAPDRLYSSYQLDGAGTSLTLNALNTGVPYFFTVDAFNRRGVTRGPAVWDDASQRVR